MAIRYTKQQKASPYFELYKKERARLQSFARSAKARGIELPENFIPKVPKNIRAGSVRKLQRITPEHGYYENATFRGINRFTGEVIESKRGSAASINRAIARYKESIREALEPTEPLSKRQLKEITDTFSKPDVFSTARHKSMLRQIENKNTQQGLEDTLKEIEKKDQETDILEASDAYLDSITQEEYNESIREWKEAEYRRQRTEEFTEKLKREETASTEDTTSIDMPGPPEGSNITNYDFYADREDLPEPAIGQDSTFTEYEPDYSETDSNFDTAFDSDYRSEIDRINMQHQLDIVNSYIDKAITYIGENVSGHMADAVRDMVDQIQSSMSAEAWANLMDDEDFWDDIASVVEEHYKSKKDPMPEVYNRISSRLSGRPMTMEENSKFEDYINSDDSNSYDI